MKYLILCLAIVACKPAPVVIEPPPVVNVDAGVPCPVACTKISSVSVTGQCCTCNGVTKTFVKSAWSGTTFLCQ